MLFRNRYYRISIKALVFVDLEGSKTRSKAQWLEKGEKPTRFFFKLECEHFEKNTVTSILNDNDTEVFSRAVLRETFFRRAN